MDNNKPATGGVGRGGRGAMLMAALKRLPRPPGESEHDKSTTVEQIASSSESSVETRSFGRGAMLQNVLRSFELGIEKSKTSSQSSRLPQISGIEPAGRESQKVFPKSNVYPEVIPQSLTVPKGRGRAEKPSPAQAAVSSCSTSIPIMKDSTTDLVHQMESVSVGQYSGSGGKLLDFEVNYIWLKVLESRNTHEYHVHFNPEVDSRSMKFRLIGQPQVKEIIGNVKNFDGAKLYLPVLLEKAETVVPANMPTDNSTVWLTITYIKEAQSRDLIHMYNVLFKRIMRELKLIQIARNYFDPSASMSIPQHKLEIWPGWVFAVQDFEGGLMLNCDASFKVLRNVTARDVMRECPGNKSQMINSALEILLHAVVLTRYNNKTYRVDDIDWEMTPKATFSTRDGKQISFIDYYQKSYGIEIQDTNQPMLLTRTKKKGPEEKEDTIYIVPELCFMTGLTDAMRSDFTVMKDMAAHTRITPNQRQIGLQRFIDNINSSPEATKILSDWNLKFDNATVSIPGRVLDREKIIFGETSIIASREADWGRDACNSKVLVPVDLRNWLLVCTKRDLSRASDFLQMMKKICPSLGIRLNDPSRCEILNDRIETFCNAIRDNVGPHVQIVVILFPARREDRYNAVKKLCCIEMPVPSQVVNIKTISNFSRLRSVTQKIVLQMNCKVGGELWALNIPLKNIMVCGIDAYHYAIHGKQSILGFVCSMNHNLTRWFSITAVQKQEQEIGDSLKGLLISALCKYHKVNHELPQKIFVFRDGVGDGMLEIVMKHEVKQLQSCFSSMQENYNPVLSVIVVQKRINTRMYEKSNLGNPPPGSVVDHTVTSKRWYDFFLVSQHVCQGTVSPTHYVIVHDNSNLKPEHMQRLSYKMTHLYYNWSGTIRVPAPCLYAHKLAYLVGQNIHKEPHNDLSDKLFYL